MNLLGLLGEDFFRVVKDKGYSIEVRELYDEVEIICSDKDYMHHVKLTFDEVYDASKVLSSSELIGYILHRIDGAFRQLRA